MDTVVFAALVWQVVDFLRELANLPTQRSAVVTQCTAWAGGVAVVAVGAHAHVTESLVLPGSALPLGALDFWSVVIVGLMVSSAASSAVDVKQAIDTHDSSAKPPLVGAPQVPAAPRPNP